MSNIISRLKNICASVKDFIKGKLAKIKEQVEKTMAGTIHPMVNTIRPNDEIQRQNTAEHAEHTGVLPSASHDRPVSKVLYNDDGTLKGTPDRNQEDVRLVKVSGFAEAFILFCSFGNQETVTSKNRGCYEQCAIDNLGERFHFEMLVKPRRYPANTIATMSVTSASDNDVPVRTIYFVKTGDS